MSRRICATTTTFAPKKVTTCAQRLKTRRSLQRLRRASVLPGYPRPWSFGSPRQRQSRPCLQGPRLRAKTATLRSRPANPLGDWRSPVSSDSFPSRTRTVIRGGVWFLLLLLMLLASCGKLLGLRDGQVQGACTTDAECAPGYGCLQSLGCHNRCNADSDCGPGSRCFKAFVTTACIPASQGCGQADIDSGAVDACPAGTRCDGSICRTQCTAAADCAGGQLCVKGACVSSDPIHETPLADGSGGTSGHGAGGTSGAGNAAGKHAGGANNGGTDSGGAEDG